MARRRRASAFFGSLEEQLRVVPVKNGRVRREDAPDGKSAVVEVDLRYGRWNVLARWLKARRRRRYVLDGLTLAVYDRLDGRATLGDLAAWLMADHALTFFEARALAINFLHLLLQRGLVAVLGPGAPDGGANAAPAPGAAIPESPEPPENTVSS